MELPEWLIFKPTELHQTSFDFSFAFMVGFVAVKKL